MKVLVAGATGAIGVPVVRALVARGHEVAGTTRSPARQARVAEAGGTPVVIDALDQEATRAAVTAVNPEAVVDVLTSLPRGGPRRAADLRATNQVRRQGSRNLLEAAMAVGVRRYVAESFFLVYGDGDHGLEPLSEEIQVPARKPSPLTQEGVDALLAKEGTVLTAAGDGQIEGMVLRFGGFYGVGAGTEEMIDLLRRRRLPVPPRSRGITPWVHIEDAAAAVAAALERGHAGGVYNVVDDRSASLVEFVRRLAEAAGAPPPLPLPAFAIGLAAPYLKRLLIDTRLQLLNRRAKEELGWEPAHPSIAEGIPAVVRQLHGGSA